MKTIVIAGTHSGVGKTTVTSGIVAALRLRGLRVQTFKAGPDYIDPSYLTAASGAPCRNLDTWLLRSDAIHELVARRAAYCDIAIVEGVMGLFDGRSGEDEEGSTAHLAKLLGASVVLVIDASAMARSAAAIAAGYQQFDRDLTLAGVILNRVGGPVHYEMCAGPIEKTTGLPVLGYLPARPEFELPERHLGLIPMAEGATGADYFAQLAAACEQQLDLDALERLATPFDRHVDPVVFPSSARPSVTRIAIARDRAFNFYYEDGLDLLQACGAELVPFSPLEDGGLPEHTDAVFIGGGFPELYARELASNEHMKIALRQAATAGKVIIGECGGLMYLGKSLLDRDGEEFEMAGVIPHRSSMHASRLTLGYREVRVLRDTPMLPVGATVRGHEFHWSELTEPSPSGTSVYEFEESEHRREGFAEGNILASYVHLHLASDARLAPNLIRASARQARAT